MSLNKTISALLICLWLCCGSCYGKIQPMGNATDSAGFAVVELFTSEGCSSCPAAETALAQVHDEYKQNVYVLEFHVDYWDYIGWKDVFSSKKYTERQQQYAEIFHLGSIYTPQAIVNGKNELVGSDRAKLHQVINERLREKPAATLQLNAKAGNGNVSVAYKINGGHNDLLNIALVQKKAETNVKRGENSGRKLQHINVVRALKTIDVVGNEGNVNILLPEGLPAGECTVIAYMQDANNWKVTAATEVTVN